MATKKLRRIGKPFDYSYGKRHREVVKQHLDKEGIDIDTVSSIERHRVFRKILIEDQRRALDRSFTNVKKTSKRDSGDYNKVITSAQDIFQNNPDVTHGSETKIDLADKKANPAEYEKLLNKIWKSDRYTRKAKSQFAKGIASAYFAKGRAELGDEYDRNMRQLDAQERDIDRSKIFGTLRSMQQSFALGLERLIAPGRLAIQGEDTAMAHQEAAQDRTWQYCESTAD